MPKWMHRINKDFRENLTSYGKSYSEIEKGCALMKKTIERLKKLTPDTEKFSKEHYDMQELLDHFEFCNDFANGTITQAQWAEYDFDGDLLGMFNDYLNEFWDLCDRYIDKETKFCWVEL